LSSNFHAKFPSVFVIVTAYGQMLGGAAEKSDNKMARMLQQRFMQGMQQ